VRWIHRHATNVRQEILKLHDQLGLTVLHVTHDFEEAITMGDRIAVIGQGAIKQVGYRTKYSVIPILNLWLASPWPAIYYPGVAMTDRDGTTVFVVDGVRFLSSSDLQGPCHAAIRPEDVLISRGMVTSDGCNQFAAVITRIVNKGSVISITADIPPSMTCLLTRHSCDQMGLAVGQRVCLTLSPSSVHLLKH
jgi:ABC-type Fe3+/spermidine/putrescine transport system ATPase subunit